MVVHFDVAENRFYFHMHYIGISGSIPAKTWWEARFDSVGSLVADVSLKRRFDSFVSAAENRNNAL